MKKNTSIQQEALEFISDTGVIKINRRFYKIMILALLAGTYISLAAFGSGMASFNLIGSTDTIGLGRLITGMVFPIGLMMVVIAGGELFSGNMLMFISVMDKKIKLHEMAKNCLFVYIGNFIGAMLIVAMIYYSGLLNTGEGALGGVTIRTAVNKVSFSFTAALMLGILCNWLVCLAVWISCAAKTISDKILSIFFIISLFVISGFEHCIANMYYIPMGIIAKSNELWLTQSGLSSDSVNGLNWNSFLFANLIPVTLGNIIGGILFVAILYDIVYKKPANKNQAF